MGAPRPSALPDPAQVADEIRLRVWRVGQEKRNPHRHPGPSSLQGGALEQADFRLTPDVIAKRASAAAIQQPQTQTGLDCFAPARNDQPIKCHHALAADVPLAVAVSGGADSMALALLLRESWQGPLTALIVDHGLRPSSAGEAEQAKGWLEQAGIPVVILTWAGEKPQTGIQAVARQARYGLMGRWCLDHGVNVLATAHHADDQAETIAMRAKRKSGPFGLRGMDAALPLWPRDDAPLLVRPLLDVRKAQLVGWLQARGHPWIEDPSNQDTRFERARLRAAGLGQEMERQDTPPFEPLTAGEVVNQANLLLGWQAGLTADGASIGYDDAFLGSNSGARSYALHVEAQLLALSHVIRHIGGSGRPPRRRDLVRFLDESNRQVRSVGTVGGCRLARYLNYIHVVREWRRIAPHDGGPVWDNRYDVSPAPDGALWQPMGERAASQLPPALRRLAQPSMPGLWRGSTLIAAPVVHFWLPEGEGAEATARPIPRIISSTVLSQPPMRLS